jgi:glutathione-regulated potassium-efflux system ancillary protein KefC
MVSMAVQAREELEAMFASDNDAIVSGDRQRWD